MPLNCSPRQRGHYNFCNWVIHDPDHNILYFFARFIGAGPCQTEWIIPGFGIYGVEKAVNDTVDKANDTEDDANGQTIAMEFIKRWGESDSLHNRFFLFDESKCVADLQQEEFPHELLSYYE
ncbi:MAG: hypothetical protein ACRDEA_17075, partial [Microcystaceae cyanobacterium]